MSADKAEGQPAVSVLVVEDEWLIAEDLKSDLEEMGYVVLGPAPNCGKALEILSSVRPDLALLDTQLGSETCQSVLDECNARGVPVVICSGHFASELPAFAQAYPVLGKPYSQQHLAEVLSAIRLDNEAGE